MRTLYALIKVVRIKIERKRKLLTTIKACFLFFCIVMIYNSALNYLNHYTRSQYRKQAMELHKQNIKTRILRERGSGCVMPKTNPFDKEIMRFITNSSLSPQCQGNDWVTCKGSTCFTLDVLQVAMPSTMCSYSDLVYVNDDKYYVGSPVKLNSTQVYNLTRSDHVKVHCKFDETRVLSPTWTGVKAGFRPVTVEVPRGREDSPSVLILAFDSVSHNEFLRRLPLAYKVLTEELGAIVLDSYNIVADATPGAFFPILTGKSELEMPDARRSNNVYLDEDKFLFKQLKLDGYHTAFFEDMPHLGTFQLRFNGFKSQPADHYLRAFFLEDFKIKVTEGKPYYCIGSKASYELMLELTREFARGDGKRFGLTMISDVTHAGPSFLGAVQPQIVTFLRLMRGLLDNTMLIVMSDHGSRFSPFRDTLQGKIEERLPFVSIALPRRLKKARPDAERNLRRNAQVLTTPFDIHTTILDVIGLKHLQNNYSVPGSTMRRGLSLINRISPTRSCVEADVLPHWCVCLNWTLIDRYHPIAQTAARTLTNFINQRLSETKQCAQRTLVSVAWAKKEYLNEQMLNFRGSLDDDSYIPQFSNQSNLSNTTFYQVEVILSPFAIFEATMTLVQRGKEGEMQIAEQDISRVNAYGDESECVRHSHPHLMKYCFCLNKYQ